MVQLKDGVGAIVRDRLFGGLSVAEAFVATIVPPAFNHEVNNSTKSYVFQKNWKIL